MEKRIVVITSDYLYTFVSETYKEINLDCEVEIVKYDNFKNIANIYNHYKDSALGFIVSGQMAHAAILKAIPDCKKPIAHFQADNVCLYRLMLKYLINAQHPDSKRIILDFLLLTHDNASMDFFINGLNLPFVRSTLEEWVERSSLSDLTAIEEKISKQIIDLWDRKEIDGAICLYSSIIPALESHGIPCSYPFPNKEQLEDMAKYILAQSELHNLYENFPSVISLKCIDDSQSCYSLMDALVNIKNDFALDVIFKEEHENIHMFTSASIVDLLTSDQTQCHLSQILRKNYHMSVLIGYGIGRNIAAAKLHASAALKQSQLSGSSFIIDKDQKVIGPLNTDCCREINGQISPEISKIAKQCKLSTLTIQKLITITKMNGNTRLTTQELAERLGVSIRNANRILKNLKTGGIATLVYTQSSISKGRPINIYELNF